MKNSFIEKNKNVAIILVDYNGYDDTKSCINSLLKIDYQDYEIVVVINGEESDLLISFLKNLSKVYYIRIGNKGFANACNEGIKFAEKNFNSDFFLLLNNDTEVTYSFLNEMMKCYFRMPGIITGRILYFFDKKTIWYAGGQYDLKYGKSSHIGINERMCEKYKEDKEISFVTGCLMLIPNYVISKVGYLDENYFMYSEDADYSIRAMRAGIKLYYAGKACIYHKVGMSLNGKNDVRDYYRIRNYLVLIRKYVKRKKGAINRYIIRCIKDIIKKRSNIYITIQAFKDASKSEW